MSLEDAVCCHINHIVNKILRATLWAAYFSQVYAGRVYMRKHAREGMSMT